MDIDKRMQKTHMIFKKSKQAKNRSKALVSAAKNLSPDALVQLLVHTLVGLSSIVHKKRIASMLESTEFEQSHLDELKPILEILDELCDDGPRLTVRALNKELTAF
jgi:hypothetical protein